MWCPTYTSDPEIIISTRAGSIGGCPLANGPAHQRGMVFVDVWIGPLGYYYSLTCGLNQSGPFSSSLWNHWFGPNTGFHVGPMCQALWAEFGPSTESSHIPHCKTHINLDLPLRVRRLHLVVGWLPVSREKKTYVVCSLKKIHEKRILFSFYKIRLEGRFCTAWPGSTSFRTTKQLDTLLLHILRVYLTATNVPDSR